jgi:hypothetical protein
LEKRGAVGEAAVSCCEGWDTLVKRFPAYSRDHVRTFGLVVHNVLGAEIYVVCLALELEGSGVGPAHRFWLCHPWCSLVASASPTIR